MSSIGDENISGADKTIEAVGGLHNIDDDHDGRAGQPHGLIRVILQTRLLNRAIRDYHLNGGEIERFQENRW